MTLSSLWDSFSLYAQNTKKNSRPEEYCDYDIRPPYFSKYGYKISTDRSILKRSESNNAAGQCAYRTAFFSGGISRIFHDGNSSCSFCFNSDACSPFLKYETADINKGLYGFNAALVGVALILLCKPTVIVWGYIVLGSILSTLVQHFFITTRDHSLHFAFCARYLGNRIFSFLFFARTDNHLFSCNSCE